jgi:hypothetical protein
MERKVTKGDDLQDKCVCVCVSSNTEITFTSLLCRSLACRALTTSICRPGAKALSGNTERQGLLHLDRNCVLIRSPTGV